eukprot:13021656-Alexandrium_andersonii.AAC.1
MKQLDGWISSWADDSLHSGVKGIGAADAWHATALKVERAQRSGDPVALTTVDLYKCYDQINRVVLYLALLKSGCPRGVVLGYVSHIESLRPFNEFAEGVGSPRYRPASIPQGCPFSMSFLGLLTVTWG